MDYIEHKDTETQRSCTKNKNNSVSLSLCVQFNRIGSTTMSVSVSRPSSLL